MPTPLEPAALSARAQQIWEGLQSDLVGFVGHPDFDKMVSSAYAFHFGRLWALVDLAAAAGVTPPDEP